jgi:site-specific DNA-methyltransferase (adenine-specific)
MTPYYEDDAVTIYHGDCREILPELADNLVDLVITSPPYNMGLTPGGNGRGMYGHTTSKGKRFHDGYENTADNTEPDEYDALHRELLVEMWRVARFGVFWNHRPRIIHGVHTEPLGGNFGIPLRQRIILDRGTGIDVGLRHFCTRGEYLYLFAKPEFQLVDHAASGMGDVWRVGIETAVPDHPAPFTLAVPTRCMNATGAGVVLDPFMGSGTTLRAAKDLGRHAIGIEISERYCEIAVNRLAQEVLPL